MDTWAELTPEALARFDAWRGRVAKPDMDFDLMEYEMDAIFAGFEAGLDGAIYTLPAEDSLSGRPETFAFKREDVVVKRGEE